MVAHKGVKYAARSKQQDFGDTSAFDSSWREVEPKPEVLPEGAQLLDGRFLIEGLLGSGGMGTVYRALDRNSGATVALKTLHSRGPLGGYAIKREFRALATVVHPNLIELQELYYDERSPVPLWFFTMPVIKGKDLVARVRHSSEGGATCDYDALRGLLPQLVSGVAALHSAGKLHRDLKPGNVLVDDDDRVVILDFGVVRDLLVAGGYHDLSEAGTPAYMAPEVLMGQKASPASDWYGVGVMLFEALSGALPRPLAGQLPSAIVPNVPADLDRLCGDLLENNPARRPTAEQIAEAFGIEVAPPVFEQQAPFVGRAAELSRLHEILVNVVPGVPQLVYLTGPSGIGKTALASEFAGTAVKQTAAFVLWNRCYEREAMPFKAVDAIVDRMSEELAEVPRPWSDEFNEEYTHARRVFPILGRSNEQLEADPGPLGEVLPKVRERGFEALGRLIEHVAMSRTLILIIDDAQWADSDSATLLVSLLRRRWAIGVVLVFTQRQSEGAFTTTFEERLATAQVDARREEIALAPLAETEALSLVERVAGESLASPEARSALQQAIREVGGLPMLVGELARLTASAGTLGRVPPSVAELLEQRLLLLPEDARRVLEVYAVVGRPLEESLALQAAGLSARDSNVIYLLSKSRLLVGNVTEGTRHFQTSHDRIREGVVQRLEPPDALRVHRSLSEVLHKTPGIEPELRLPHLVGAQRWEEARDVALECAQRADRAFAFERAAALYQQAFDLAPDDENNWQVAEMVGNAYANAGRGALAGAAYERAATLLPNWRSGAEPATLMRLRTRAAEQYLQSACDGEGLRVIRSVLREHGIAYPTSNAATLALLLANRFKLILRGFDFEPRTSVDSLTEARLESLWVASKSLSFVNAMPATLFSVLLTLQAFRAGHAGYLARGLSMVAAQEGMVESDYLYRRADRLADLVRQIADGSGSAYERGFYHLSRAATSWFRGNFAATVEQSDLAARAFASLGHGASYELAVCDLWGLHALGMTGDLLELAKRTAEVRREAQARGDLFSERNAVLGPSALARLAADEPSLALERANAVMAGVDTELAVHSYHLLVTRVQIAWYEGRVADAWAQVVSSWPGLSAAFFDKMACLRDELLHLRAHAALAVAAQCADGAIVPGLSRRGLDKEGLLRLAEKDAAQIAAHRLPPCAPFAALIRASAAHVRGNRAEASASLQGALDGFDAAGMMLYRESCRWALSRLADERATPDSAWFDDQRVVHPERLVRALAPAL